jgi:hypothetical protein
MTEKNLDRLLDEAIEAIHGDRMDPAVERKAAAAVWARLADEASCGDPAEQKILGHEDFQALIPAYVKGELSGARALLLKDHVGECVPCRRALKNARTDGAHKPAGQLGRQRGAVEVWGWRLAAAAVIVVALIGLDIKTDLFTIQAEGLIQIERVEGQVFRVTDDGTLPVNAGEQLSFNQVKALRTGKDSNAMFRMSDDSLVEVDERAELAVYNKKKFWQRGRGDGVVDLGRGNIIVEASPQGSGHLFVETPDAEVAVTGTVFAVNSGIKGSRVTVIEGSVAVDSAERHDLLVPGEQTTTTTLLGRTRIEDEIEWSRNKLRHLALLAEATRAVREIEQRIDWPSLRYDTTLLDRAPANTVVYVAIPNIAEQIGQGYEMLQTKIAENEMLANWWSEEVVGTEAEAKIASLIDNVRAYGAALGSEVVLALPQRDGEVSEPTILAQLRDEKAFTEMVRNDIEEHGATIRLIEGDLMLTASPAGEADMLLWSHDGMLVAAKDMRQLEQAAAGMQTGRGAFYGSKFHSSLSQLYRDGAEWIVAADLGSLIPDDEQELETLGLADLQHLIGERKVKGDRTETRLVVDFDKPRKGLASWLAEPAPMGSLDFVSGNASFAAGFLMRDPSSVVEELFAMAGSSSGSFDSGLAEFEAETGIDLQDDFLAAIGGEFAVAFDGPVVPVPSWKLILEVYDPALLQTTLAKMVKLINDHAAEANANIKGLELREHPNGRVPFYEIASLDVGLSVHYTYVDGYLVAGSSRGLINRALQNRANGLTLVNSGRFQAALPADSQVHFSAVVYQDLGSVLGPLARTLGAMTQNFSQDQQEILSQFSGSMEPSVALAYGETDRIVFVNSQQGGLLSSTLGSFLRFNSLMGMQELLTHAAAELGE